MCLIIVKPFGKTVPLEHVTNAFEANSDGIGISYRHADDAEITIDRSMSLKRFIKAHEARFADPDVELVVHTRWATTGSKKLDNCHPFKTHTGIAFHHNGILSIKTENDETDSETFMRHYFGEFQPGSANDEAFKSYIEALIPGSKLALHSTSGVTLFNERLGHWRDGVWYSNYSYEAYDDRFSAWPAPSLKYYEDEEFLEDVDVVEVLRDYLPNNNPLAKARIIAIVEAYLEQCADESELLELRH